MKSAAISTHYFRKVATSALPREILDPPLSIGVYFFSVRAVCIFFLLQVSFRFPQMSHIY